MSEAGAIIWRHAPVGKVSYAEALSVLKRWLQFLTPPGVYGRHTCSPNNYKQAIPFAIQMFTLAESGLTGCTEAILRTVPDGVEQGYFVVVLNFEEYLGANPERSVETMGEPWPVLMSRLLLTWALHDEAFAASQSGADLTVRASSQCYNGLSFWMNDKEEAAEAPPVEARLRDGRKTGKLWRDFSPSLRHVIRNLPLLGAKSGRPEECLPGTSTLWREIINRASRRLDYSTLRSEIDLGEIGEIVKQLYVWTIVEDSDGSVKDLERLADWLGTSVPADDPWPRLVVRSQAYLDLEFESAPFVPKLVD